MDASPRQQSNNNVEIRAFLTDEEWADPELVEFWANDTTTTKSPCPAGNTCNCCPGGSFCKNANTMGRSGSFDREQTASGNPRPDPPEPREPSASGTAEGSMGTAHLERLSLVPCQPLVWQGSNRRGRQSRLQRLEVEPTQRASKIARTTTPDIIATVERTPRRREAFRHLINVACGRNSTVGQATTQASYRQHSDTDQRPP